MSFLLALLAGLCIMLLLDIPFYIKKRIEKNLIEREEISAEYTKNWFAISPHVEYKNYEYKRFDPEILYKIDASAKTWRNQLDEYMRAYGRYHPDSNVSNKYKSKRRSRILDKLLK